MIAYDIATHKIRDVLNRIFGESWSFSCPIPDVINNIPVDKHFLYSISSDTNQSRPFALVISAMDTGTILILKHCAAEDFVDTTVYPLNTLISNEFPKKMSVKEYKDGMRQLHDAYENLRQIVFKNRTPAEKGEATFDHYLALVKGVTPISHVPYYAAILRKP